MTDHMLGYCYYGMSMKQPPGASQEFLEGYRAHRWEQIARVVAYCVEHSNEGQK